MLELDEFISGYDCAVPYISEKTMEIHYGKHHRAYVDKVNELIIGTKFQDMPLSEIILQSFNNDELKVLYNNAGQVYNHNIYWQSFMIWEKLDEAIKTEILLTFGGIEALKGKLIDESMKVFGSGWVWLVKNKDGNFAVISTKNGDTPLVINAEPVFNIDMWEHAYYLDYQNLRTRYVEQFINGVLKL